MKKILSFRETNAFAIEMGVEVDPGEQDEAKNIRKFEVWAADISAHGDLLLGRSIEHHLDRLVRESHRRAK